VREPPALSPEVRPFLVALGVVAAVAVIGLIALWPGETQTEVGAGVAGPTESGKVVSADEGPCPGAVTDEQSCLSATVEVNSGPDAGETVPVDLGGGGLAPDLEPGDEVRLTRSESPPAVLAPQSGAAQGPPATTPTGQATPAAYSFADFQRGQPMLILAIAFALLVVLFGRLRGALSLVGLALSLVVILVFIVPAILDGESPLAVALVGSVTVMLLTISLAHGFGAKSIAAMLGTAVSLALVAVLALIATEATNLTGLASEEAAVLSLGDADLSFEGLLLAGIVIGALGVLDDVTVSQASTVLALRAANPDLSVRELYRRAVTVGRDHVSATVNTLVLAYAGAALPVLLIFSSSRVSALDAVNTELVAKEVVATLVGSIGLIAAVPITTAIAARLSTGLRRERAGMEPAHHH
jgi:uncharacterized membrane protein